jgi:hypothetical protein
MPRPNLTLRHAMCPAPERRPLTASLNLLILAEHGRQVKSNRSVRASGRVVPKCGCGSRSRALSGAKGLLHRQLSEGQKGNTQKCRQAQPARQ